VSRIGNALVTIPKGVEVKTSGKTISVKGPRGNLSFEVPERIDFKHEGDTLKFARPSNEREDRAAHGMARARVANLVKGVSEGFTRVLEINGVGYRAAVKGDSVDLTLGFSHPVSYKLPPGIKAEFKDGKLTLFGADKIALGQAAADIRKWRPPEPYKGKGVKYLEERIQRKEGKRGKK
jgi:large subunit ribosomal protein L6